MTTRLQPPTLLISINPSSHRTLPLTIIVLKMSSYQGYYVANAFQNVTLPQGNNNNNYFAAFQGHYHVPMPEGHYYMYATAIPGPFTSQQSTTSQRLSIIP